MSKENVDKTLKCKVSFCLPFVETTSAPESFCNIDESLQSCSSSGTHATAFRCILVFRFMQRTLLKAQSCSETKALIVKVLTDLSSCLENARPSEETR